MGTEPHLAISRRLARLAGKLRDKLYRDSFVAARCRRFLAHQMRALRGDMSQAEFGKLLDKPQSVVSRLEDPTYGKMTLNSLLEVAAKTDRALLVQFVDWKTLLKMVADESEEASAPTPYDQIDIQSFVQAEALKDAAIGLQPIFGDGAQSDVASSCIVNLGWGALMNAPAQQLHPYNFSRAVFCDWMTLRFKQVELPDNSIEQIVIGARAQQTDNVVPDAHIIETMQRAIGIMQ
jgi:hypothetical protein